jgi:hypothetical protein
MEINRASLAPLQAQIKALREVGEDYLILSVGVRGPNLDCDEGNAVATVRMGNDEATSEALHLVDAILLARGKVLRERKAREAKREKEKAALTKATGESA